VIEAERALLERIARVVARVESSSVEAVASKLSSLGAMPMTSALGGLLEGVQSAEARSQLGDLLKRWLKEAPQVLPDSLAWALRGAEAAAHRARQEQALALVWTGPCPPNATFRRSDQALLEVVRGAKKKLWIVAFAAHRVPTVLAELRDAIGRGVEVTFVLESEHESQGKLKNDGLAALPSSLLANCSVHVWPQEQRARFAEAEHQTVLGVLHAKCALADDVSLLVSSANFTSSALFSNIELGLLIRGGALPRQVGQQLRWMVTHGVLAKAT
jgi:phosphatidylserine/phosphatidylglycerophosphate/cardiolipin synthase-like enzyme